MRLWPRLRGGIGPPRSGDLQWLAVQPFCSRPVLPVLLLGFAWQAAAQGRPPLALVFGLMVMFLI